MNETGGTNAGGSAPARRGPEHGAAARPAAREPVSIAPMKRRHLRAVTAIERVSNPHPWSHSLFAGELRMPTSRHWLVARRNREVIGFVGLMWTLDEGHITNFAVRPDNRRRQVATALLAAQCRDAIGLGVAAMSLEVRMSNAAARSLYARFGFAPGGVRRGYYNDNGEDALVMWLHGMDGPDFDRRLASIESDLPAGFHREAR